MSMLKWQNLHWNSEGYISRKEYHPYPHSLNCERICDVINYNNKHFHIEVLINCMPWLDRILAS